MGLLADVNAFRAANGRRSLRWAPTLYWAARRKAADIERCGFSHTACGRDAFHWIAAGYGRFRPSWSAGENLAMADGPAHALRLWRGSTMGHREVLLGRWRHIGYAKRGRIWVCCFGGG